MGFKLRSQGQPFKMMGSSPVKSDKTGNETTETKTTLTMAERRANLLKAVPNEDAYNKLSDEDKEGFNVAAKRVGLPMKPDTETPLKQTTTEQDRREGDIAINDPIKNPDGSLSSSEGMYGPGKGKKLSELSKKELEALGFSPKKIKEIMAVDPDAPGTPGKPGYEPPVKRKDLDAEGKKIFDKNNKK